MTISQLAPASRGPLLVWHTASAPRGRNRAHQLRWICTPQTVPGATEERASGGGAGGRPRPPCGAREQRGGACARSRCTSSGACRPRSSGGERAGDGRPAAAAVRTHSRMKVPVSVAEKAFAPMAAEGCERTIAAQQRPAAALEQVIDEA